MCWHLGHLDTAVPLTSVDGCHPPPCSAERTGGGGSASSGGGDGEGGLGTAAIAGLAVAALLLCVVVAFLAIRYGSGSKEDRGERVRQVSNGVYANPIFGNGAFTLTLTLTFACVAVDTPVTPASTDTHYKHPCCLAEDAATPCP